MGDLLKICEQGSVQQLQEYIVRCPIDGKAARDNIRLCEALHVAAGNGHEHVVAFLLGLGADVNCSNKYGWTPLMQAARNGHTATVLLLLSQGAQPDARNCFGATAFTCAVRSGHVSTVRAILNNGSRWTESENPVDGQRVEFTALMVAANLGHDPILRLLLDHGFDVNQSSYTTGVTALIMAAAGGRARTMQILIEWGADVTAVSRGGRTALDVAVACKRRQVRCILEQKLADVKLQKESGQKKLDIFEAIQSGRLDEVRICLSKDRTILTNYRSTNGLTPLMFASQLGDSASVELLVNAGAELDSTDAVSGWTALIFALFHGHNEVALQLLQAGASVNIHTRRGLIAFDIATSIGTIKPELIVLIARNTEDQLLHPLASIVCHDEPDMKLSLPLVKSKTIYDSLGKTLGHLWPLKHRQKCENAPIFRPIRYPQVVPQMAVYNSDGNDPLRRAPFIESEGCGGAMLPLISASPCRWALSEYPVRPVPPLLPSQSFDASISAGNINMSLNLPVSRGAIDGNGNALEKRFGENDSTPLVPGCTVPDNLLEILKKCSLDQWASTFSDEEVDLEAFKLLTEADLLSLGFKETSVRNSLLRVIAEVNQW